MYCDLPCQTGSATGSPNGAAAQRGYAIARVNSMPEPTDFVDDTS